MGTRIKNFDSTGVAPNGKLFAGDLNGIQDQYADLFNLLQAFGVGTMAIGETGLQIVRFGVGEARLTGSIRTDGIIRALGGLYFGAFTTAQRDALTATQRPFGLVILNTTTNRLEINLGTSTPSWQPLAGSTISRGTFGTIPSPGLSNLNTFYFATDQNGGTLFYSDGTTWTKIAPGLNEQKVPIDGSVTTAKIADGAVTAQKVAAGTLTTNEIADGTILGTDIASSTITADLIAPGGGGADDYGTVFPTSNLFNGYRFTLIVPNPAGGSIAQEFIYRADLDATLPWHSTGKREILIARDAGTSTGSTTFSDWLSYTTLRQGDYDVQFQSRFALNTNVNAPSGIARLLVAGSEVRRVQSQSGTSEPPSTFGTRYFAQNVAAGAIIKIQIAVSVNDSGQVATLDQADFTVSIRKAV